MNKKVTLLFKSHNHKIHSDSFTFFYENVPSLIDIIKPQINKRNNWLINNKDYRYCILIYKCWIKLDRNILIQVK